MTILHSGLVPIGLFGQDHWALLLQVEDICVHRHGRITKTSNDLRTYVPGTGWDGRPTYLNNGAMTSPEHDDWVCLEDFQLAGIIVNAHPTDGELMLKLTDYGWHLAGQLRRWHAEGHDYARFRAPARKLSVAEQLTSLNIDGLGPIQALTKLYELQRVALGEISAPQAAKVGP